MTGYPRIVTEKFGTVIQMEQHNRLRCAGCVGKDADCSTLPDCRSATNTTYVFIPDTDEALAEHILRRMNGVTKGKP